MVRNVLIGKNFVDWFELCKLVQNVSIGSNCVDWFKLCWLVKTFVDSFKPLLSVSNFNANFDDLFQLYWKLWWSVLTFIAYLLQAVLIGFAFDWDFTSNFSVRFRLYFGLWWSILTFIRVSFAASEGSSFREMVFCMLSGFYPEMM